MDTTQIYTLVNEVTEQAIGRQAIRATDAQSLITLGETVLSSQTNTEAFLNTLVQRIGRTIVRFQDYRNKLADMVLSDFEYGAIVQKISVEMPKAMEDPSFDLTDGQSIDHYTIYKPKAKQKFFYTRTPYMFAITIQRKNLKEAFLSETGLAGFIAAVFGEVRNAMEIGLENLGRTCLANMVAESTHEIRLVTDFNTEMNLTGTDALNATTAKNNDLFLNYAVGRINHHATMMKEMSILYNDGSKPMFTPDKDRVIRILSDFDTRLQTVTQYAAYHDRYVKIGGLWDSMAFWQNITDESTIQVERASDGQATRVNNLVAVMYTKQALGIFKKEEEVMTTPVNAKGMYYNTFWHHKQLWFNDMAENFCYFTLN